MSLFFSKKIFAEIWFYFLNSWRYKKQTEKNSQVFGLYAFFKSYEKSFRCYFFKICHNKNIMEKSFLVTQMNTKTLSIQSQLKQTQELTPWKCNKLQEEACVYTEVSTRKISVYRKNFKRKKWFYMSLHVEININKISCQEQATNYLNESNLSAQ